MKCLLTSLNLLLTLTLIAALGCSGQNVKDPDGDGSRLKARPFSHTGPTNDRLNASGGDKQDWRFYAPATSGKVKIRISIGKWKESTISGNVVVFSEVGDRLIERAIMVGSGELSFTFEVKSGLRYLVLFKARSGRGEYAVEITAAVDPCSKCTDSQECVDGQCIDKGPCGGCDDGQYCNTKRKRCEKLRVNKCKGVSCPSGKVCARRTGKCVIKKKRCPKGTVLKGTECIEKLSDIKCSIIDARSAGGGSMLILSAGRNKGVRKGAYGKVKGLRGGTFKITAVYPGRSKARCKLPATKVYGHNKAVIRR